ncbi:MAG TPA: 2-C-methyl-D-erythritol 2,4-cyclodiphosphate synthase, partial [Limnochordia bacterium]
RVGVGFDVHRFVSGRPLVLGGVEIPSDRGLLGHSDADVLVHAIMDSLLGAAGRGDIGRHFPDSDPAYAGISSLRLLERVSALLAAERWEVRHVDAVLVAERPRIGPHVAAMTERIARALGVAAERINLKATTAEGLGAIGREEGIAAWATATLSRPGGAV